MKRCSKCGLEKPLSDFHRTARRGRDGYVSECKTCRREYAQRRWQNPEVRERQRERVLRERFGITLAEYHRMLDRQHGRCAVCFEEPEDETLAVDHCHATGKVRGLLCRRCNVTIGAVADDPDLLKALADYIACNWTYGATA